MLNTGGGGAKGERFFSLFLFDLGFRLFLTLVSHRRTSQPDHSSIYEGNYLWEDVKAWVAENSKKSLRAGASSAIR
jgi:hypothetical protein